MSTSNGKLKDGRQVDRIDNYAKHWQKDLKTDTKVRFFQRRLLTKELTRLYIDGH